MYGGKAYDASIPRIMHKVTICLKSVPESEFITESLGTFIPTRRFGHLPRRTARSALDNYMLIDILLVITRRNVKRMVISPTVLQVVIRNTIQLVIIKKALDDGLKLPECVVGKTTI